MSWTALHTEEHLADCREHPGIITHVDILCHQDTATCLLIRTCTPLGAKSEQEPTQTFPFQYDLAVGS